MYIALKQKKIWIEAMNRYNFLHTWTRPDIDPFTVGRQWKWNYACRILVTPPMEFRPILTIEKILGNIVVALPLNDPDPNLSLIMSTDTFKEYYEPL